MGVIASVFLVVSMFAAFFVAINLVNINKHEGDEDER